MPVVDIVIAVGIVISILVGFARGFVKEAFSVASLLIAVWVSFNFGHEAGKLGSEFLSSAGMQLWFGRILVFVVVLALGGLLGFAIGKLVRWSVLSGMDRGLGMLFGMGRAAVLGGIFVIGGQYASFDQDEWWQKSQLIPHLSQVADWLRVMAPKGMEFLQSPDVAPELPVDVTDILKRET